jgi:homoserine O-acetyltransferase
MVRSIQTRNGLTTTRLFREAPLVMQDGSTLRDVQVAFETYGTLSRDASNAVLVCHALTGDSHVASHHPDDDPGWWEGVVGPGRLVDTRRFFVICPNVLGSCYGTAGPLTKDPATGEIWGARFPYPAMRDVVWVQRELLLALGVERVALVIGGSLGGQQVLQWAVQYPEAVGAGVAMACNERASPWVIALQDVGRFAILNALKYPDIPELLDQALATARMLAMISYRTPQELSARFGRNEVEPARRAEGDLRYEVESYLRYQGQKLVDRFEAQSYLRLTRLLDTFDVSSGFASVDEALSRVQAPLCLVGIDTDVLFESRGPQRLAGRLRNLGKDAEFRLLSTPYGHDAFLIETPQLEQLLRPFFERAVGRG